VKRFSVRIASNKEIDPTCWWSCKIAGYVKNPNGEMMDGYALGSCWLTA
jgi:hypothetical protein